MNIQISPVSINNLKHVLAKKKSVLHKNMDIQHFGSPATIYILVDLNGIGGVLVGMLVLGLTKEYKIGIYFFSAKQASLRSTSKTDWLGIRIKSLWSDMSTRRLLFQRACTIQNLNYACWPRTKCTSSSISSNVNCSCYD